MVKKRLIGTMALVLCGAFGMSVAAGCNGKNSRGKKDSIVIMTEELSGLFNPFYATAGTDQDVVGMTQISMLSTNSNGDIVVGEDLPTVVKDYDIKTVNNETTYTFVLKNGIKFSDGVPLTMNDVIFNLYEYLDPVYTGSSTMYSIDIKGLAKYRTQKNLSSGNASDEISNNANAYARLRVMELSSLYKNNFNKGTVTSPSYEATVEQMEELINSSSTIVSNGYKLAVATTKEQATLTDADYRAKLLADYKLTQETFKKEIEADFKAAKESYDLNTLPYSEHRDKMENDVFKFLLYEGKITAEYAKLPGSSRDDKTKILKFNNESILDRYSTEEAAIDYVYSETLKYNLDQVLSFWGTYGTLVTQYAADATEVIIKQNMGSSDGLLFPNIDGIVSLGHTTETSAVTINNVAYTVAHSHNADGTPANENEYDVLQITINGIDPKAIYNFGFSVAPVHYYSADSEHPNGREVDIANNKFGVEYASSSFQSRVIQSQLHQEVPVGAGAYKATNRANEDNPSGSSFVSGNIVYYKANHNFMFPVKTEKIQMQVASSSNALDKLQNGEVDYAVPQFTRDNAERLDGMKKDGFEQMEAWQLGYGYIGINAGKVPKIGVRKAIMAAMQTSLATEYYKSGTCQTINWPMSTVSWAYPRVGTTDKSNGKDYMMWGDSTEKGATTHPSAVAEIRRYAAGASPSDLKITFTIAGASITEHPTYEVFKQAAEILNNECYDMGWQVEVKADSQALTKLATGSLAVWAAAWGSTIDPDMYQVYHKNSNATSVYAWGYREIKAAPTQYPEETKIIGDLAVLIDQGRATDNQNARKEIYEKAMGLVLDLAVELPVYQRKNLYAYNSKTVKGFPESVNHYSSPLERIWELELTV